MSRAALPAKRKQARRKPGGAEAPGWEGWDAYAPFYDWENAQTVARRDVAFHANSWSAMPRSRQIA